MMTFKAWREQGQFFKYAEHQIYYRFQAHQESNRPTLLLLHGYPTASFDWHKIWDDLGHYFNLVTYDYLGYGSSDKPKGFDYHTSIQASIGEGLLEHLDIKECIILAHDYGDTVLQEMLARQNSQRLPFKINAAAMLNGGIFIAANRPILIQRLMISPIGPLIGLLNNRFMYALNLQRVFSKQHRLSEFEIAQLWEMTCYKGGRTLLPNLQKYLIERVDNEPRWRAALIDASCPLVFISGEKDSISGKHMREYYEKHMPEAKTARIEVGHYPQLEDPQSVLKHTLDFFSDLGFIKN